MGSFKDMLGKALADNKKTNEKKSHANAVHTDYKNKFTALIGEPIIWRTKQNADLKAPQLVVVEEPHDHYVVVVKTSLNVEGVENKIRYGILYSSLYCGFDKYHTLEFSS